MTDLIPPGGPEESGELSADLRARARRLVTEFPSEVFTDDGLDYFTASVDDASAVVASLLASYDQKQADFARETLRTSELTRELDDLRRRLGGSVSDVDRYAEGDQVEIYTLGRWERGDVCRDFGIEGVEVRDWGRQLHRCRREDIRRREMRPAPLPDSETAKVAAFDRVKARIDEIQQRDRYALVNVNQLADLLRPDGLWSCSFADGVPADQSADEGGQK